MKAAPRTPSREEIILALTKNRALANEIATRVRLANSLVRKMQEMGMSLDTLIQKADLFEKDAEATLFLKGDGEPTLETLGRVCCVLDLEPHIQLASLGTIPKD